jgi:endonuclease III
LFQYCVWEIVSANAQTAKRDLAWLALRHIAALTPDAMFRAAPKDLQHAVDLAGPDRDARINRIRATAEDFRRFRDRLDRDVSKDAGLLRGARALRRLTQFDTFARARALLFCAGHAVLPIDSDVARVIARLIGQRDRRHRRAIKSWLAGQIQRDAAAYREAVIYMRHHAHHTCVAVSPHCTVCPLRPVCAFGRGVT